VEVYLPVIAHSSPIFDHLFGRGLGKVSNIKIELYSGRSDIAGEGDNVKGIEYIRQDPRDQTPPRFDYVLIDPSHLSHFFPFGGTN
jgi:alkyl hydroperoxide reductase subunit AhpF